MALLQHGAQCVDVVNVGDRGHGTAPGERLGAAWIARDDGHRLTLIEQRHGDG